jgi:RNA polymerase sigma-70 factor (ECF subfamily)
LKPYVARRAPTAEVDDIIQDILVKMQLGLDGLRDGERFGGWVYRIAEHVLIDAARARSKQPVGAAEVIPDLSVPSDERSIEELQVALGECIALFVARLPSPYREAITLTELEGLTQREAAEMLGISLSGMKSRVQRGRDKIREMFDDCCQVTVDCRGRVVECQARDASEVPADCRDAAMSWAARHQR